MNGTSANIEFFFVHQRFTGLLFDIVAAKSVSTYPHPVFHRGHGAYGVGWIVGVEGVEERRVEESGYYSNHYFAGYSCRRYRRLRTRNNRHLRRRRCWRRNGTFDRPRPPCAPPTTIGSPRTQPQWHRVRCAVETNGAERTIWRGDIIIIIIKFYWVALIKMNCNFKS